MRYAWAIPGQKVVCVNGDWPGARVWEEIRDDVPVRLPMFREVLTIKDVIGDHSHITGFPITCDVSLTFVELGHDWSFDVGNFRPLHDLKSDIALFQRIADKAGHRVPEGV